MQKHSNLLILSKISFIVICLIWTIHTDCPADYQLDKLQSGSIKFDVNSSSPTITTMLYTHTFINIFARVPSLAFTLRSFTITTPILTQWSITLKQASSSKMTITFRHTPANWSSIQVGYFSNVRPQFTLGSTTSNLSPVKNTQVRVTLNFNSPIANYNTSIVRTYITGFIMTNGTEISIQLFQSNVTQNQIQINVDVQNNMEITSITINFIIFSPTTSPFSSYGGQITENNFQDSQLYHLGDSIYASPYNIYGFSSIHLNTPSTVTMSMTPDFYLQLDSSSPLPSINITYIIIGKSSSSICLNCQSQPLIDRSSCTSSCPPGTYQNSFPDGGIGCMYCPAQYGMVVNSNKNGCVCRNGFIGENGLCFDPLSQKIYFNPSLTVNYFTGVVAAISAKQTLSFVPPTFHVLTNPNNTSPTTPVSPAEVVTTNPQIPPTLPPVITSPLPQIPPPPPPPPPPQPPQSPPPLSQPYPTYIPTSPSPQINPQTPTPPPIQNSPPLPPPKPSQPHKSSNTFIQGNCTEDQNSYWTGYSCACKVSFTNNNGICVPISLGLSSNLLRPSEFVEKPTVLDTVQNMPKIGMGIPRNIDPNINYPIGNPQTVINGPPLINPQSMINIPLTINQQPIVDPQQYINPPIINNQQPMVNTPPFTNPPIINQQSNIYPPPIINQQPNIYPPPTINQQTIVNPPQYINPPPINNGQPNLYPLPIINQQPNNLYPPPIINQQPNIYPSPNNRPINPPPNKQLFNPPINPLINPPQSSPFNPSPMNPLPPPPPPSSYPPPTNPNQPITPPPLNSTLSFQQQQTNPINLSLVNKVSYNYNNIFINLQTPKSYPNLSDSDKKSFIKYQFPNPATTPSSAYCLQSSNQLNQFECLLVYASGIPNQPFQVNFTYGYMTDSGSITINVNPLQSTFPIRSLR